ncbi:MAG: alpha/beta fold hydrolase [Bacteroidales bacterium]
MRKFLFLLTMALAALFTGCQKKQAPGGDALIGPKDLKVENGLLTPELLWAMGRVSEVEVSPDGSKILFGVSWYDVAQNKGNRELYVMNVDGSERKQITYTSFSEQEARWTPEGKITFLSPESGSMQVWMMDADGRNRKQITQIEAGVNGYRFSKDMKLLVYSSDVPRKRINEKLFEGLDKTSGRLMNDLMYRHWDSWVDAYSHIFIAYYNGQTISTGKDIMEGEPWESPVRPWGGMEQVAISPDGKTIAYTCRKKEGKAYALSTNTDIYLYNLETGHTTNLTEGMAGYDMEPVFSPDGSRIAWLSMERDGYEADLNRLFMADLKSGEKTWLSQGFDNDLASPCWSPDGSKIYSIAVVEGTHQVYVFDFNTQKLSPLTQGAHDYKSIVASAQGLYGIKMSISKPDEIYAIDPNTGVDREISFINKPLLEQIKMGEVKARWIKTTDGKQMHSWIIFPPDFDSTKAYPTLLFCAGGPQNAVSQFWSYRWNFQIMAAHGYIVVAPNRRGVPGFGQAWKEQISGDYGGQNMQDYLSAIDDVAAEPWSDENRLAAVGASYGGFSVYWLAGHHNKRFKAFIAHDGMFNLESQYLETEEMWFVNWDLGGPYWDKGNPVAQRSYANSPHRFVDKWDTPILIIHGEKDYRIVASQGMAAFNAAILRGIPAEYLYFPDENHWVLKPQNSVLWQRVFFDWLDKWLK